MKIQQYKLLHHQTHVPDYCYTFIIFLVLIIHNTKYLLKYKKKKHFYRYSLINKILYTKKISHSTTTDRVVF